MASSISLACVRHVSARHSCAPLRRAQRRWARVHDVRFVTTQHANESVTDRYRQKLASKAKSEGFEDIGSLKGAYKEKISELRKQAIVPGANAPLQTHSTPNPQPQPPPPEQPLDAITPSSPNHKAPGIKTLDSFLDMSKILELPSREIEALWRLRHAQSPSTLCASLPTRTFESMLANARKYPQFILPGLPRKPTDEEAAAVAENKGDITAEEIKDEQMGTPIHFMQWAFPSRDSATVMFTHLAEFKLRGEYTQPHTTITFHTELAGPKGLVLSQGSVIENRGTSIDEGKWLVMCLQKFYHVGEHLEESETSDIGRDLLKRRRGLVEMFNRGDPTFTLEAVVDEAERMG